MIKPWFGKLTSQIAFFIHNAFVASMHPQGVSLPSHHSTSLFLVFPISKCGCQLGTPSVIHKDEPFLKQVTCYTHFPWRSYWHYLAFFIDELGFNVRLDLPDCFDAFEDGVGGSGLERHWAEVSLACVRV